MKKIIEKVKKYNPSKYAITLLLLTPLLFYNIYSFKIDNDFWFLTNIGKIILKKGFITTEPFTIHNNLSFIPQQWLTDIIFHLTYNTFNIRGIYILIILCTTLIIYILYKTAYLISNDKKKSCLITVTSTSLLIIYNIIVTRPQTFDTIIFSLELFYLESYILKQNKKYLYPLPILSLLQINLHSSTWLMFYILMIPYYTEYIISKLKNNTTYKIKPLIIITLISLIIGLINPYGIKSIMYIFKSYGIPEINNSIIEMTPITINNNLLFYVIIFILFYSFYYNKGKNKIRYILLTLGITYLSLKHYRGILYLYIICVLIFSYNFKTNITRKPTTIQRKNKIIYLILITLLLIIIIFNPNINDGVEIKDFANYLDKNSTKKIKLFTGYNDGAYMEYRGYKCYIDARAEVFLKSNNKKEDIFTEYYKLLNNDLNINKFLEKYQFDYLLVDNSHKNLLNTLIKSNKYTKILSKKDKHHKRYLFKKNNNK